MIKENIQGFQATVVVCIWFLCVVHGCVDDDRHTEVMDRLTALESAVGGEE